jgi:hypothetical protein
MVDFGSGQGLSVFATDGAAVTAIAGIVWLFRKTVNGYAIIAKKRKRRPGPKDAISGWTLTINFQTEKRVDRKPSIRRLLLPP